VLFYLFFSAARGLTAGPILTSNISKRVFLRLLHSFVGENNDITISLGQNPPKHPKIGPNRHFPTKMPKSYNSNISKTVTSNHVWYRRYSPPVVPFATGWTGVDMSTPLLPETIPEIDADPASFSGGGGSSQRSSLAKNVSFCSAPPFTCLLEWNLCGSWRDVDGYPK